MTILLRGFVVAVLALLSGCAIPFYWQAIGGQIELLRKRVPIETVIADDSADAELKQKLRDVLAMREFAVTELGLPDNKSYRSYASLNRQFVVWNVVATEEFSVEPQRWCYPFVGCVSYRGFFERQRADEFAASLARRGLDTYVGGASAYSTLGFFADPVLSTMLAGGEEYVAEVLFHELTHQRLYIKDDSELSEAFATAVSEYGTVQWLESRGASAAAERYQERLRFRADFAELVRSEQQMLADLFARDDAPAVKRAEKARAYDDMRAAYARMRSGWGGFSGYDNWFSMPLNNAQLAAVATYQHWVPALRRELEARGLPAFFEEMQQMASLSFEERRDRLQTWLVAGLNAQRPRAAVPADADDDHQ
jgi:predicted aminopeptidase